MDAKAGYAENQRYAYFYRTEAYSAAWSGAFPRILRTTAANGPTCTKAIRTVPVFRCFPAGNGEDDADSRGAKVGTDA